MYLGFGTGLTHALFIKKFFPILAYTCCLGIAGGFGLCSIEFYQLYQNVKYCWEYENRFTFL